MARRKLSKRKQEAAAKKKEEKEEKILRCLESISSGEYTIRGAARVPEASIRLRMKNGNNSVKMVTTLYFYFPIYFFLCL